MTTARNDDEFNYSRNLTANAAADYQHLVGCYVSSLMDTFDDYGGLDKSNLWDAKKFASAHYRGSPLSSTAKFAAWAEALVAVFVKDGE